MNYKQKFLSVFLLAALLALTLITPARAFDGRSGDRVVIGADEVVEDDLYVAAEEFVLDGTVNGDVIVFARNVTINGRVDGDLFAAAQTVAVNGEVTGATRIAGSVLFAGDKASIGGDVVGAGYSFEGQEGSAIGRDLVFAGGQILLASDVARNVQAATGRVRSAWKRGRGRQSASRGCRPESGRTAADHVHATIPNSGAKRQTGSDNRSECIHRRRP